MCEFLRPAYRHFRHAAHSRQRRPQVVRDIVCDVLKFRNELFRIGVHAVERPDQIVDLNAVVFHGNPFAEVAGLNDMLCRGVEPFDSGNELACNEPAAEGA